MSKAEKKHYIPPQWCKMSPHDHFDGMGGCWGVSYGYVEQRGMAYCKDCECADKKYIYGMKHYFKRGL